MASDNETSVFDMLTAKNPEISHAEVENPTNTRNVGWHVPERITEWTDFNSTSLKDVYGGTLLEAALQRSCRKFRQADIQEYDRFVESEVGTTNIYTLWNRQIVNHALGSVNDKFNLSVWLLPTTNSVTSTQNTPRTSGRPTPERGCKPSPKPTAVRKIHRPDGGARLLSEILSGVGSLQGGEERLPKEYKTYGKWKSSDLKKVLDKNGNVVEGQETSSQMWPIRQIFTYCVASKCRYGCILTTGEAFIIRIRPLKRVQPRSAKTDVMDHSLINAGLLEYVSIPWDSYKEQQTHSFDTWTVNLALWYIHVLAGNSHNLDWSYGRLRDEVPSRAPYRTPDKTPKVTSKTLSVTGIEKKGVFVSPSKLGKRKKRNRGMVATTADDASYSGLHSSFTSHDRFSPEGLPEFTSQDADWGEETASSSALEAEDDEAEDDVSTASHRELRSSERSSNKRLRTGRRL